MESNTSEGSKAGRKVLGRARSEGSLDGQWAKPARTEVCSEDVQWKKDSLQSDKENRLAGSILSIGKKVTHRFQSLAHLDADPLHLRPGFGLTSSPQAVDQSSSQGESVQPVQSRSTHHVEHHNNRAILFDDVVSAKNRHETAQLKADLRFLIMPWSNFLTVWRTLMVVVVLWAVIFAPFEISFSWWTPGTMIKVLSRLVDVFCITDMCMNFFIVTIKYGRLVSKRRLIVKNYLKSWFAIDLLTNIPWDLIVADQSSGKSRKVVKVLKLPKVLRLTRLFRVAREEAHSVGTVFTISGMLLLAHYFSCLWVALLIDCQAGQNCPDIMQAWAEGLSVGMATLSGSDAWLRFAFEGPALGGERNFEWRSPPGVGVELVAVCTCLIGFCALGMLFSNISRAMDKQDSHTRKFNERLNNVKAAAQQHGMSKDIYSRARRHFHYVWSCGSDSSRELLADKTLSADLRRELAFSFYGELLRKVPFLAHAEETLLKQICKSAQMEVFSPLDNIIMAGECSSELFFLVAGSVTVRNPIDGSVLRTLDEGSFFGEVALFHPNQAHIVTVQASSFGWLLVVERDCITEFCTDELMEAFRSVAMERNEYEFAYFKSEAEPGNKSSPPNSNGVHQDSSSQADGRQPSKRDSAAMQDLPRDALERKRSSLGNFKLPAEAQVALELDDCELWEFANRMEAKIDLWAGSLERRLAALEHTEGELSRDGAATLEANIGSDFAG